MKYYLHEVIYQMLKYFTMYMRILHKYNSFRLQDTCYSILKCLSGFENLVSLWVGEYAIHFLSLGILDEDFTAFLAFSHEHNNSSLFVDIATADR